MAKVEIENRSKIFFPGCGITKGDLVDYYRRVAPAMLPHIRNRPVTMERFPDGIGREGFFQKEIPDYFPAWIERVTVPKKGGSITHPLCNDEDSLVYIVSQGCITPHVWLSEKDRPSRPDRIVFDLDPPAGKPAAVRQAARRLRTELERLGLRSVVMTTGSKGFHVTVPILPEWEFAAVRRFARQIAKRVAAAHPEKITVEQRKQARGGRVYLDTMRNGYAQTVVAPYAVRTRPGAPVATPVGWEELGRGLEPDRYHLRNLFRRLGQKDDPWQDLDEVRQELILETVE